MADGRKLLLPAALAFVLVAASPALAQEPVTILNQMEWRVSGVCVGVDQCGFCTATDSATDGIALRITPPDGVSVEVAGKPTASSAVLDFGSLSFTLERVSDGNFAAAGATGNRIIQVMRNEPSLALKLLGDPATTPYRYRLDEFPKAYAAILKACPGSGPP